METFMTSLTVWHWFGLAAILSILEVTLGASFFLLWFALSAVIIAIILMLMPTLGWQYQLLIFAIGSLASISFWAMRLKNTSMKTNISTLNRRSEQYLNRVFTLAEPIINGRGKIKVDDSFWIVEGPELALGKRVRVIDINGLILKVKEDA